MATDDGAVSCAPTKAWRELFEVAHRFLAQPEDVAYQGTRVGPVAVDGEECLSFPYAVSSDEVHRIISLLYEIGAVFPFDWMKWDGVRRYRGRTSLRTAPVADAARMATAIVRGERFCEGRIGSAIQDGTFSATLDRLLRWYDSERALTGEDRRPNLDGPAPGDTTWLAVAGCWGAREQGVEHAS